MPDVSTTPSKPELARAFASLQQHFAEVVVPLWQGPGWNADMALPYESLDRQHRPLPTQRYRAMACARQLFVFASLHEQLPGAPARAAALFASLQRYFHDPVHGGWFYSVDPQGAPLDRRKDLYTHAFVIFACAHYWRRVRSAEVAAALDEALALLPARFADGQGLYEAVLDENWAGQGGGPLQNPLMHLAEALLAVTEARSDADTEALLLGLLDGMQQRFIDREHGVMLEKPLGAVDNWHEPGHQFEWFYLLASTPRLHAHPLFASLSRAFAHAEAQGVNVDSGAVTAMLNVDGQVIDGTLRIWAQAEYLRALTLHPDAHARLGRQLSALRQRFLRSEGWNECLDSAGVVSRHDMPSTTPYHLLTCYQGLARFFTD